MPEPRLYFGLTAASNGKLYVVGGRVGSAAVGTVREYDPVANLWTNCGSSCPPMPTGRTFLGLATAPNGRLYAVGDSATVEEYDPKNGPNGIWTVKPAVANLTVGLANAASAVFEGRIYVFGGRDGAGQPQQKVYEYTPSVN
jgi:hypothetical protein